MSYEEKDWIALDHCPICGKETGIAFDKRMKKSMSKHVVTDPHLCDDCLKDAKEKGWFIIYEADPQPHKKEPKFTGRFLKVNIMCLSENLPETAKRFVETNRFICMPSDDFDDLIQREEKKLNELKNTDDSEGPSVA